MKSGNNKSRAKKGTLRVCEKGHSYYKSSDCPVCPACEKNRVPAEEFLSVVAAPARRALESAGIKTLSQLSEFTEQDLLSLHGFGNSSLPPLRKLLGTNKLSFKKKK